MAHRGFKLQRVGDLQAGHIHNVLAVVGHQRLAVFLAHLARATQRSKLLHDTLGGHGNHFHRQRKLAQRCDQFGLVGNTHKLLGQRRHNLLAGQCRTAALDHVALTVNFVRAVDVNGQRLHCIGVQHRNTERLQPFCAGHRAGDSTLDLVLDGGQSVDEFVDSGASADTHKLAGHHVCQGRVAHQSLEFVLGQGGRCGGGCGGRCRHGGKSEVKFHRLSNAPHSLRPRPPLFVWP